MPNAWELPCLYRHVLVSLPMCDLSLLYIFRQHFLHIATKLHQTVSLLIHCDSNTLCRRKETCTTLLRCRATLDVSMCSWISTIKSTVVCVCAPTHAGTHAHTLYMYILNLSISNLQLEKTIYFAAHQLAFSRLGRLQEAKNKTKLVGIN